ncbi:hypothetical protein NB640_09300 [Oxalobacter vibrioformis]|uniref:Uncharacterized protein n=1 Tax=Oxalobacter vibrioformis TaxID=933080 RepID=A0A9E9LYA2_9BURK|nr:hypothetical protein [Oxalobacter vibrioformis]WAW09438.1 hypothetical protein NB640_09300 [Oxalobacter vibrioformis]
MNTSYIYLALLDVIGYRARLEEDIQNADFSFKEDLQKALSFLSSVNTAVFNYQAISDTIILTCNTHNNFLKFLEILKDTFIAFLERDLYIRGGLAYARHFQNGNLTYSHAVTLAHELENKHATYPRILISPNLIEMYRSGSELQEIFGKKLLVYQNGVYFLNILDNENWDQVHDLARKIYISSKEKITFNESAFMKHLWFENYLFSSPFANHQKKYIKNFEID